MADNNAQKIKDFNARASARQQGIAAGAQPATPITTVTPVVSPTAKMSVGDIQLLMADPTTLSQDQLLRRDALSTKENLRIADEAKKKQEAAERAAALQQRNARKVLMGEGQRLIGEGLDRTTPVGRWLESRPKPGGIATLLIIICVFLLAIVPVNAQGDTRLKLIWLTLTGKTYIDYSQTGQTTADQTGQTATTNINALPASQQPYIPPTPVQPTTSIPNLNPAMGDVITSAFGIPPLGYEP